MSEKILDGADKEVIKEKGVKAGGSPLQENKVEITTNKVNDALSYMDLEAQILDEQYKAIESNPEVKKHLHIQRKPTSLPASLEARERMVLETYSQQPYVTPAGYRNPEDLDVFYRYFPVRPQYFPDAMIERLFDIKFEHTRESKQGALEREEYYPMLRRLLSTLKQMSFKPAVKGQKVWSNRIFVLTGPEFNGLLISRVPDRRKINNYYADIYTAIRSQKHALHYYTGEARTEKSGELSLTGELELLKKMRFQTQQIIASLQMWKSTSLEERDNVKLLIEDLENFLVQDINEYKLKARSQYSAAKTLKDEGMDRLNPGSASARLVSSFNELQKRAAGIFKIMRHVGDDLDLMERARQSMEISFNKTRLYLNTLLDREYFKPLEQGGNGISRIKNNAPVINNELLDKKNPNKGVTTLLKEIEENKGTPSPFKEWAEAVLSNLRIVYKLNKKITEEKMTADEIRITHNQICEYAIRAQLALRYQQIQQTFVQMLDMFLDHPGHISAYDIRNKFEKILNDFNPHALGKKFQRRDDIKFIDTAFQPMTSLIAHIIKLTYEWDSKRFETVENIANYKAEISNSEEVSDVQAEKLMSLEDENEDCNREYRDKIYELIKNCDFTKPIKSLTAEVLP